MTPSSPNATAEGRTIHANRMTSFTQHPDPPSYAPFEGRPDFAAALRQAASHYGECDRMAEPLVWVDLSREAETLNIILEGVTSELKRCQSSDPELAYQIPLTKLMDFHNGLLQLFNRVQEALRKLESHPGDLSYKDHVMKGSRKALIAEYHALLRKAKKASSDCEHNINQIMHKLQIHESRRAESQTEQILKLSEMSRQDYKAMRAISLLTILFLPGTFIASVFSMTVFDFDTHQRVEPNFGWRMTLNVVGVITICTVGVYFIWEWYLSRTKKLPRTNNLHLANESRKPRWSLANTSVLSSKPCEGVDSTVTSGSAFLWPGRTSRYQPGNHQACQHPIKDHPPSKRALKRKRPEPEDNEKSNRNGRFPCIYFVGDETGQYASHTKKHEHISQLVRHLRSHDFFVCSKCFTRFPDAEAALDHELQPCTKACRNRRCRRFLPANVLTRPENCDCITTPEQQWIQLFKLEYPDRPIRDIFSDLDNRSSSNDAATDSDTIDFLEFDASDTVGQWQLQAGTADMMEHTSEDFSLSDLDNWDVHNFDLEGQLDTHAQAQSNTWPLNNPVQSSSSQEEHSASTRPLMASQAQSTPSEREQDLEMALSVVWEALRRTGSIEAQPDSAVFRVLRRHAPSVLGPT